MHRTTGAPTPECSHLTSTEACPEDSSSICCSLACRQAHALHCHSINQAQLGHTSLAGPASPLRGACLRNHGGPPLAVPFTHPDLFDFPLQVLHPQLPLANLISHLLLLLAEPLGGGVGPPVNMLHCGGRGRRARQGGELALACMRCAHLWHADTHWKPARQAGRQARRRTGRQAGSQARPTNSQSPSSSTASSPKPQEAPAALPAPERATCICTWATCSSRSLRAASACRERGHSNGGQPLTISCLMPCHAMPCHAMPCHAMPCNAMQCHAMQYSC